MDQVTNKTEQVSIIIPVFNERRWLPEVFSRLQATSFCGLPTEFIVVDDASTDGSSAWLHLWIKEQQHLAKEPGKIWRLAQHPTNSGKGAAIQTGISVATGSVILIQDADLEYDPADYTPLIERLLSGQFSVVYGSRLSNKEGVEGFKPLFYLGNRLLTWVTNLLYGTQLTDMETCYKAFRADVIKGLNLQAKRFDIEPEITALIARQGIPILEQPIHYHGRNNQQGKKITCLDGLQALWTLIRCRWQTNIACYDKSSTNLLLFPPVRE